MISAQPQGAAFFQGGGARGGGGFPFAGFPGGFPGGFGGGGNRGGGRTCTKSTQCFNGQCTTTEVCY